MHVLRSMIEVKGPLTVAEFMTRALSHPDHGYYMKKDVFGSQGDFTTAPEISQMFGELIAVWCVATWQQMGMPAHIKIVEMGPGRGSLMSDFLRASKSFPPFYEAIEIHMVDISPGKAAVLQCMSGGDEVADDVYLLALRPASDAEDSAGDAQVRADRGQDCAGEHDAAAGQRPHRALARRLCECAAWPESHDRPGALRRAAGASVRVHGPVRAAR